jgi:hydroxyacylglutathione hydrolase
MLSVIPIPAFNDNYIWLLQRAETNRAVVVDPGQAEPVLAYLQAHGLTLEAILITHHHHDHVGGIEELLANTPVPVFGPVNPAIKNISQTLSEGDEIQVLDETLQVLEVPGHTLDHIAYVTDKPEQPLLFCGDSLFSAGCGRLFEGTAEQMYHSLQKYTALSPKTDIFATHEYTLANLDFAIAVEPENQALRDYQKKCLQLREDGEPTLPTTLKQELAINPFLRSSEASLKRNVSSHFALPLADPVDVFRHTRLWKDKF